MLDTLLGLAPRAGTNRNGWFSAGPEDPYWYSPRSSSTTAGITVTEELALTYSTVYACVNVLSQAMSTLPGHVFRRKENGNTKDAEPVDHPLNGILSRRANKNTTGVSFRNAMMANGLLWGNQFAEIVEDDNGEVSDLWNIPSRDVEIKKDEDDNLFYVVDRHDGSREVLNSEQVLHIPGLSIDGVLGMSPIAANRAAVALGQACVEFGSAYFGNGAWSTGFVTGAPNNPKNMSAEAGKKLIDSINEQFRGAGKAFGWGLLRGDLDFKQIEMPFEDAMFLATREFQRIEICSIFNVPPSKIQDLDKATFSNVEQQDLAWAKSTLLPLIISTEKAIDKQFFDDTDLFYKFNLDGLIRGDFKTRMEGIAIGRQNGIFNGDESRALLDMPPIDGEGGKDYWIPSNMEIVGKPRIAVVGAIAEEQEPEETEGQALLEAPEPVAQVDLVEAFRPAVEDAARRIATKESKAIVNALKRFEKNNDSEKLRLWIDKFYGEHLVYSESVITPVFTSFQNAGGSPNCTVGAIAGRYTTSNHALYADAHDPSNLIEVADPMLVACIRELTESILSAFSNQEV